MNQGPDIGPCSVIGDGRLHYMRNGFADNIPCERFGAGRSEAGRLRRTAHLAWRH